MPEAVRRFAARTVARLSMPLLWKELAEGAARPRTYVLRVVYAMALYGLFAFALPRLTDRRNYGGGPSFPSSAELLGWGSWIFERLQSFQLWGITLFQPALMCGRITQEKERDSLVLLFLTELRPWEIVLQKYVGGLVPMLSFLFLSLPLAGVAYALGGLESATILDVALGLLLTVLQVGALALLFSAWCRTTVTALISTYFWGAVLYFTPPLVGRMMINMQRHGAALTYRYASWQDTEYWKLLNPTDGISLARSLHAPVWHCLLPSFGTILLCLGLTRWFLVRRAFAPPSHFLPRLFARIDRWMKGANRFVGGLVLYREASSLPVTEPVFWRETQRRVLGKAHYLLRLLCAIEIPTVLLLMCLLMVFGDAYETGGMLAFATAVLVGLAVLILSATASNSLVSERVGQTLDVLLTTPVSAREIVRQKERALRRLEWVLVVPLLTVFATHAFFLTSMDNPSTARSWVPYLGCWGLTLAIYFPMITWLSLWIGLRVRTRFQGILITLSVLIFWMVALPFMIAMTADRLGFNPEDCIWVLLASPISVPFLNEVGELHRMGQSPNGPDMIWQIILINSVLYTAIALLIRFSLFRAADRCLRR